MRLICKVKMMKRLIITVLLFITSIAQAGTLYVSEAASVIMRAAPDSHATILRTISRGTPVELIKKIPNFDLVRTEKNTRGWLASQFLSTKLPRQMQGSLVQKASDFVQQSFTIFHNKFFTASTPAVVQLLQNSRQLEKENKLLRSENSKLQLYNDLKWFLIGAGVLAVGIILGLIIARFRKKRKWRGGWD